MFGGTLLCTGRVAGHLESIAGLLGAGDANGPGQDEKQASKLCPFTLNCRIFILLMTKSPHLSSSSSHLAPYEMSMSVSSWMRATS